MRDVSLDVPRGEITALLGPNGAGKSSLVLAVAGVLRPTGGAVRVGGVDLSGRRPERVRRAGVATVPEGHRVLGDLSVGDNLRVAAGRLPRRCPGGCARARARAVRRASRAGDRRAGSLSGGQQQMLALGQAIVSQPRYLVDRRAVARPGAGRRAPAGARAARDRRSKASACCSSSSSPRWRSASRRPRTFSCADACGCPRRGDAARAARPACRHLPPQRHRRPRPSRPTHDRREQSHDQLHVPTLDRLHADVEDFEPDVIVVGGGSAGAATARGFVDGGSPGAAARGRRRGRQPGDPRSRPPARAVDDRGGLGVRDRSAAARVRPPPVVAAWAGARRVELPQRDDLGPRDGRRLRHLGLRRCRRLGVG